MFTRHEMDLLPGRLRFYQAGQGPVLVHVHTGAGLLWTAGLERLTQAFTVVVPVLPGFDGTARLPSVRGAEDLGDLVGDFLKARWADGPVHLSGASFGGQVVAWTAILHPDRVRRLVLVAPAGLRTPDLEKPLIRTDAHFAPEPFYAHPERRRPDTRGAAVLQSDAATFAAYLGGRFFDETLSRRLREVRCPTLVLCGTADAVVTEKALHHLRAIIDGARVEQVPDAGNALDSDQPEEFAARVAGFLQSGPAADAA